MAFGELSLGGPIDEALGTALASGELRSAEAMELERRAAPYYAAQVAVWEEYRASILAPQQAIWDAAISTLKDNPVSAAIYRKHVDQDEGWANHFGKVQWRFSRFAQRNGQDVRLTVSVTNGEMEYIDGGEPGFNSMTLDEMDAIRYLYDGERMIPSGTFRKAPVLGVQPKPKGEARRMTRSEVASRLSESILAHTTTLIGSVSYEVLGQQKTGSLLRASVDAPSEVVDRDTKYLETEPKVVLDHLIPDMQQESSKPPKVEKVHKYLRRMYIKPGIGKGYEDFSALLNLMHDSQPVLLPEKH